MSLHSSDTRFRISFSPRRDLHSVIGYLRDHIKEDFSWGYYLTVLTFIGGCIVWNYFGFEHGTGENWLIRKTYGSEWGILAYVGFYAVPYYLILVFQSIYLKETGFWKDKEFWTRSLLGLFLLSLDAAFYYYRYTGDLAEHPYMRYFVLKCAGNLISVVAIFVPLYIWYRAVDRKRLGDFYGLKLSGFNLRPYLWMLLMMVPLVAAASFLPDFLKAYPNFQPAKMMNVPDIPLWLGYLIYEPIYLSDYTWTEVIFRGFMVIGMMGVLGKNAVMPMVGIYAFRHFAKPLGETIGSIFGGWILGVIALRSRNIMGGVLLHMGIAGLMDLFAGLQWIFK